MNNTITYFIGSALMTAAVFINNGLATALLTAGLLVLAYTLGRVITEVR
jgi:hypothetical protein